MSPMIDYLSNLFKKALLEKHGLSSDNNRDSQVSQRGRLNLNSQDVSNLHWIGLGVLKKII